ncbi:hypothetical protein EVAR_33704_1 [Eumeta japonica]|uniref:Uncharacterized protein n=1 Tax=Eumeta variegata TaxID=151549 RepID=A0A4C1VSN8_EUMVA|nr:hypothetical protein EVAR_33704_1 [Eumeta japonica]
MVRILLRIAKEEDLSPTEHRPTDGRGSGTVYISATKDPIILFLRNITREVVERPTAPKRTPQNASPKTRAVSPTKRRLGMRQEKALRSYLRPQTKGRGRSTNKRRKIATSVTVRPGIDVEN